MGSFTLLLSIAICLLIMTVKRDKWLIIYIAALIWYPTYLTVKLGTIDFSLSRIVIFWIFLNLIFRRNVLTTFKFALIDYVMILYVILRFVSTISTTPLMSALENQGGFAFDSLLPFFSVRLLLRSKSDYITFLKGVVVVTVPLAFIGIIQSTTGYNPASFFYQFSTWETGLERKLMRFGFYRAEVTFSHSILFGLFFAMLCPLIIGLWGHLKKHKFIVFASIIIMYLGVLSSVSSAPVYAGFISVLILLLYPFRRYWAGLLIIFISGCVVVEILSNRHIYEVLTTFALSGDTAYYRIELIKEAFGGGMEGHWLNGYGLVGGIYQENLNPDFNWKHFDITNNYILLLARYGLLGLIPFLGVIFATIISLRKAYVESLQNKNRWMVWCLGASIAGILIAMQTVSLFDQSGIVFYIFLGMAASMPAVIWSAENEL